jgi:hypothetical protein
MESFVREPEFTTTITITGQESRWVLNQEWKLCSPSWNQYCVGQQSESRIRNIMFDPPPSWNLKEVLKASIWKLWTTSVRTETKMGGFMNHTPYSPVHSCWANPHEQPIAPTKSQLQDISKLPCPQQQQLPLLVQDFIKATIIAIAIHFYLQSEAVAHTHACTHTYICYESNAQKLKSTDSKLWLLNRRIRPSSRVACKFCWKPIMDLVRYFRQTMGTKTGHVMYYNLKDKECSVYP